MVQKLLKAILGLDLSEVPEVKKELLKTNLIMGLINTFPEHASTLKQEVAKLRGDIKPQKEGGVKKVDLRREITPITAATIGNKIWSSVGGKIKDNGIVRDPQCATCKSTNDFLIYSDGSINKLKQIIVDEGGKVEDAGITAVEMARYIQKLRSANTAVAAEAAEQVEAEAVIQEKIELKDTLVVTKEPIKIPAAPKGGRKK